MAGKQPFHWILCVLALFAASASASAQSFTQSAEGKALFDGLCEGCHGVNGTGDEGPALNRPNLPLATDEAALRRIIRDGIPDRGMPRVRRMTDDEVVTLATYVRSLGRSAPVTVAGNAGRGRAVYQRLDCAACHVISGQGGVLGPELTKIGERRAPNYLRQALLEPGSVLSKGVLGILQNGFTEYLPVSVVEKNGREVRGIRVNEDSFTIQVRDADGKFYSFRKGNVEHVDKQFGRSLMPSYKDKLNASDTDDLVAYLYSLGGPK
jgi:putative heme-binding domain-containing protein